MHTQRQLQKCTGVGTLPCDDGNSCTQDSCEAAARCVKVDASGACDDGSACTAGDTCSGGECKGGTMCGSHAQCQGTG